MPKNNSIGCRSNEFIENMLSKPEVKWNKEVFFLIQVNTFLQRDVSFSTIRSHRKDIVVSVDRLSLSTRFFYERKSHAEQISNRNKFKNSPDHSQHEETSAVDIFFYSTRWTKYSKIHKSKIDRNRIQVEFTEVNDTSLHQAVIASSIPYSRKLFEILRVSSCSITKCRDDNIVWRKLDVAPRKTIRHPKHFKRSMMTPDELFSRSWDVSQFRRRFLNFFTNYLSSKKFKNLQLGNKFWRKIQIKPVFRLNQRRKLW